MSDKNFRLSRAIQAERYVYSVAPDLITKTFSARGRAELRLGEATNTIVLHGVALDIVRAVVGGAAVAVSVDDVSQTLLFTLPATLSGAVTLELEWTGKFHDDLRGLYKAGKMGVTQFEAADARRVFPCLDEPDFKAVWELTLEAPAHLNLISNGPVISETPIEGGKKRVAFAPTPRMSSYLVALIIGELGSSEPFSVGAIPIRTWAVPEKIALTGFAQQCAAAVLPMLETYFGQPYAFGKLDQVAVPDFEAGAMENAGCVTYREIALLIDEQRTPLNVRKRVAEVITHELSHQWFGNLVTMQWWDDLWLNEAFATWIAFKIVDQWKPEWRIWDDFEQGKQMALRLDALGSTHPIRYEVCNASQATENFDAVTYEKGGAILRMFEGFLGEDKFRAGIRAYMARYRFSNTVADDLWNALGEASGFPIAEIAATWLTREGYPVLRLEREGGTLRLHQDRFMLDPEAPVDAAPWIVPVVLSYQDDEGLKTRSVLMRGRTEQVDLETDSLKWICGNANGAGFYRVLYRDADLHALAERGPVLKPAEAVNLLSDTWAAFRSRRLGLVTFLELLTRLATVADYAVAGEVANRFAALERLCVTEASSAMYRKWVSSVVSPGFERVGWGRGQIPDGQSLLRAALLRSLAGAGRQEEAVRELGKRLRADWQGREQLDPNLLDTAWIATARGGDAALFERLLEKARTQTDDPASKRRALVSLASFEAPQLRGRAIELILDETVPMQDVTIYLSALVNNTSLRAPLWDFIETRWDALRARCAAPFLTRRLVEALGGLLGYRVQVEALLESRASDLREVPAAIRQTREGMRLDAEVQTRSVPALSAWLSSQPE
jgi:puromycin-sensitive aminopeptidase